MNTLQQIVDLFERGDVRIRLLHHEETRTSEKAAEVRGEPLEIGAKAIVLKVDQEFKLFVMSAARRLDSKLIRAYFGARKTRFASPEELLELTGLVPGSVPPFGWPILELPLYADPSVFVHDRVAFNAGSLTDSIITSTESYRRMAEPIIFSFTKPPAET